MTPRGGGTSRPGRRSIPPSSSTVQIPRPRPRDRCRRRRCVVEPGIVLDELRRSLSPTASGFRLYLHGVGRHHRRHGWQRFLRRDRSLRYGNTRENVLSIDAVLADGSAVHLTAVSADLSDLADDTALKPLARALLALGAREAVRSRRDFRRSSAGSAARISTQLTPGSNDLNLAHILVGSEGTLAHLQCD